MRIHSRLSFCLATAITFLFTCFLGACNRCGSDESVLQERAPAARPAIASGPTAATKAANGEAVDPPMVREQKQLMSTVYAISVVTTRDVEARAAIAQVFEEIDRIEKSLSEWIPESEISRINQAAGSGAWLSASDDVRANLQFGKQVSEWSNGALDLSWAALRDLYLFQRGQERVPTDEQIAERLPLVNFRDIEMRGPSIRHGLRGSPTEGQVGRTPFEIRLKRTGMMLGTGTIAKGYALDRGGAILEAAGFNDYMIFGGGQVQTHGSKAGRPWRVGIQHPRRSDYIGFVEVNDAAVATAGDYLHSFVDPQGKRWHHIIDPTTGRPAERSMSVTAIVRGTPNLADASCGNCAGTYADGIDTACFVMGAEACMAALSRYPTPVSVVIIDSEGRVHMSEDLRETYVPHMQLVDGRIP